ncbi:MAG: YjhX family toxin, partial [Paracoccaceae bacterium]
SMNISKTEQRVLHVLAQGGHIAHLREDGARKISEILCVTREGTILADCTLALFRRLRARGLIASAGGGPYRITYLGRRMVRGQVDNQ